MFLSHVAGLSRNVIHGCTTGQRRHGALPGGSSWAVSGSGHCVQHLAFGLMDLLRLDTDWYGLGSSVLDKKRYENRLNETTQKVSDLIVESNYWKVN